MSETTVECRIVIRPDTSKTWEEFFQIFPDVDYLVWEGVKGETYDLTVYFKGSDEPFPYSSLRSASWLKLALKGQYGL